jgi:hypothetical protein
VFVVHSKTNRLLSVGYNYCSLFWNSYMFRSFSITIGLSIQYYKVRLKMYDKYLWNAYKKYYNLKMHKIVKNL